MRRLTCTLAALTLSLAYAQPAATLSSIQVEGTSDLTATLVRVNVPAQEGDLVSQVNLAAVQQAVLDLGFFQSATVEWRTVAEKMVLHIQVVPNPTIKEVKVDSQFLDSARVISGLESDFNIAAGVLLNNGRLEQSKQALAAAYRQAGFPFAPAITTELLNNAEGSATLQYRIDEAPAVRSVVVSGATAVTAEELQAAFSALVTAGKFDVQSYQQGVKNAANSYADRGFLGSGLDLTQTELKDGVLNVTVRELILDKIDRSTLSDAAQVVPLTVQTGQVFNIDTLNADVRNLSNAAGETINAQYNVDPNNPTKVILNFSRNPQIATKVSDIAIQGSGVVPIEELKSLLRVQVGDIYNVQLAQEDYLRIQREYRKRGYELSTQPDPISFTDGKLLLNLREVKVTGYKLNWSRAPQTQERVILRELPEVGSLYNADALRTGLSKMMQTGLIRPPQVNLQPDPSNPNGVTVVLALAETSTSTLLPALEYSTLTGWTGQLAYNENNLFGLGHKLGVSIDANINDAGQPLGAQLNYSIPWLDVDFLDFAKVPTQVSTSVFSNVQPNNIIYTDATNTTKTGREYSQRSTGFTASLARPLSKNVRFGVDYSSEWNQNYLEKDTSKPASTFTDLQAMALMPDNGNSHQIFTSLSFDNVNSNDFPTEGVRANVGVGVGIGTQGSTPLAWTQASGGARTYLGFGAKASNGLPQQALAARVNAGTTLGSVASSRLFAVGGSDSGERFTLHGYDSRAFTGTNFVTSSLEYRYNLDVSASFAQGIYAVAFADVGDAWTNSADFNLNYGYGAGVQINLGIGTTILPALRFDYAFSPANPRGKFSFRIGSFF